MDFITISFIDHFTEEHEALRNEGFGERWGADLRDNADSCSSYITIIYKSQIIASVRITPGFRYSILQEWFNGTYPSRPNSDFVEITRGVVLRDYQGLGFYKLMFCEAILHCTQFAFSSIYCAVRQDLAQISFLHTLGFNEIGQPKEVHTKSGTIMLQPLCLRVKESKSKVMAINQGIIKHLKDKNIQVQYDITTRHIVNGSVTREVLNETLK